MDLTSPHQINLAQILYLHKMINESIDFFYYYNTGMKFLLLFISD
jgi:hypothetical protein